MAVLSIQKLSTGISEIIATSQINQVGQPSSLIFINTDDDTATVGTMGYLNDAIRFYGQTLTDKQLVVVYTTDNGQQLYQISIAGDNISLTATGNTNLENLSFVTKTDETGSLSNSEPLSPKASGIMASTTGTGEIETRVITGTANEVDITNGDGQSGNPTASLSNTLVVPGNFTIGSGYTVNNISNNASTVLDTDLMTANAIQTAIGNAELGAAQFRGAYDASSNMFPSTGGTGPSGEIEAGNWWYISVAGTLGGEPVDPGDQIFAIINDPGQTASNWVINNPRVKSVFNRTGAVVGADGDYSYDQITGLPDTATSGKIMRADGASWTETTAQYPDTAGTSGNVLTSDGTNWISSPSSSSSASFGYLLYNNLTFTDETVTAFDTYESFASKFTSGFTLLNAQDFDEPADGQLRYTGTSTRNFLVTAIAGCGVGASRGVAIAIYKNGSIVTNAENYMTSGGDVVRFNLIISDFLIELSNNDYLEIFIKRNSTVGNLAIYGSAISAKVYP